MHVKKGDKVMVISGDHDHRGKVGVVLKAFPKRDRVIVEGINFIKKHLKPSAMNQQGGIIEKEASIHVSNVMPLDPKTGKPTRVGYKIINGKKVRVAVKTGNRLDKK